MIFFYQIYNLLSNEKVPSLSISLLKTMTGSEKALPRNTRMSNLIVNKRKGKEEEEEKEHLDGFTLMCFA